MIRQGLTNRLHLLKVVIVRLQAGEIPLQLVVTIHIQDSIRDFSALSLYSLLQDLLADVDLSLYQRVLELLCPVQSPAQGQPALGTGSRGSREHGLHTRLAATRQVIQRHSEAERLTCDGRTRSPAASEKACRTSWSYISDTHAPYPPNRVINCACVNPRVSSSYQMFTTVCSDKRRRAPAAGQFRPAMLQRPSVRFLSQLWPLAAYLMMVLAGDCPQYIGEFRDCTCGLSYRDEEVRCCTADTCQAPLLSSTNLSCPFACQNGGTLKERERDCSCSPGFFGVCCERGERDGGSATIIGWRDYCFITQPTEAAKQICNTTSDFCAFVSTNSIPS